MEITPWPVGIRTSPASSRGLTTSPPTRLDGMRSAAACRCSAGVRETKQALGRREVDLPTKHVDDFRSRCPQTRLVRMVVTRCCRLVTGPSSRQVGVMSTDQVPEIKEIRATNDIL